jgi:uncharacterized repeat protein (TIGR03943 family)
MINRNDASQNEASYSPMSGAHPSARESFQALAQTIILLGLAFYSANLVFSDNLKNYSNQPVWLSLGASGLLLLLGLASGARFLRLRAVRSLPDAHLEHAHNHGRRPLSWIVPAILAVPLLFGTLFPSQPLGAAAMGGNPRSNPAVVHRSGPPLKEPNAWNVQEWQSAMIHGVHPKSWFDGQKADLIGFVVRPPDIPAGDFIAARFVMYHCAADARGVAMLVTWKDAAKLSDDTWVRVRGTVRLDQINGGPVMRLHADSVDDTIGEPEAPYLTPLLRNDQPSW